ncbi:carboxylesterase/lipase family protein [Sphingomonas adhaesiva]|uniref:carboxylesterase/lipase family protein n=1 Tax=Sphingomonas adhaesiva TaxID=28212 RepID=UPI002FFBE81C
MIAGIVALLAAAAPVATTEAGPVRGTTAAGHVVFRGIPFAAPPVGERRWAAPVAPSRWKGVRDATAPASSCPQADYGWNHGDYVFQSEDCLTLDVGTTALAGRRPVLVWIHGGGNYAGSPGDTVQSPIVGKGVVVVAVRYRLGALGFLHRRDGTGGNVGLQDQIAALRWVKANVARFGGDPDMVTIAGESAGGQDVGLLIAAPAARGLFRRAIMGSGTPGFGLPWRTREEALRMGDQFDALMKVGGDAATLRRTASSAAIATGEQLHDPVLTADDYRWLRTTVDGAVLPEAPDRLIAARPALDLLIGTDRFELDLPGGRTRRDAFVATAFGANEARARAFYRMDQADPAPDPRMGTLDQQIATDVTFRCPAQRMARVIADKGGKVWSYEFDEVPDGPMTHHAAEMPYLYGDKPLGALRLMEYWANFVKTGDPNGATLPAWPAYGAQGAYLALDATGARPASGLRADICQWTNRL